MTLDEPTWLAMARRDKERADRAAHDDYLAEKAMESSDAEAARWQYRWAQQSAERERVWYQSATPDRRCYAVDGDTDRIEL